MTIARATQVVVRAVSDGTPKAVVTQLSARAVSDGTPKARVSQVVIRMVSTNVPNDGLAGSTRPVICVST